MTKKKIFNIIQIGNREDIPSHAFDIFISLVIFANIIVMFIHTYDNLSYLFPITKTVEAITIAIFCIEYVLRIWTADLLYPQLSKGRAVAKFLISFDGIIDLFTILPFFYLSGFVAFRMLRVVRIFHLFRINNQYDSFNVIYSVIKDKRNQIFSSLFIIIILMLASSLGIYSAEHQAQPDVFQNAFSGIWWTVSTLLTVGYGDIYPITVAGRIMAILIAFLGVGVVAIPTGIISAGFVEHYSRAVQLANFADDVALDFMTVRINDSHCWNGHTVKEITLPTGFILATVYRDGEAIIPRDELIFKTNDAAILATETYFSEMILIHNIK